MPFLQFPPSFNKDACGRYVTPYDFSTSGNGFGSVDDHGIVGVGSDGVGGAAVVEHSGEGVDSEDVRWCVCAGGGCIGCVPLLLNFIVGDKVRSEC